METRAQGGRTGIGLAATASVLVFGVFALMPFVVGHFREMLSDLGGDLPALTRFVLAVPNAAWIAVGVLGGVLTFAKQRVVSAQRRRDVNVIIIVLALLLVPVVVAALYLPVLEMVESIK